jgi:hypothetical protein
MEYELMFIAFDYWLSKNVEAGQDFDSPFEFDFTQQLALDRCQQGEAKDGLAFYEGRLYRVLEISMQRAHWATLIKDGTIRVTANFGEAHFYEWFGPLHLERFDSKWIDVLLPPLADEAWAHIALVRNTPATERTCWECKQGPRNCWIHPYPSRSYCASCWKKTFYNWRNYFKR